MNKQDEIFTKFVKCLGILWRSDDTMSQDDLFELQDAMNELAIQMADTKVKKHILVTRFPYVFKID